METEKKDAPMMKKVKVVMKEKGVTGTNMYLELECVDWKISKEVYGIKPMVEVYLDERDAEIAMIPLENVLYIIDV